MIGLRKSFLLSVLGAAFILAVQPLPSSADDARHAWLRHAPLRGAAAKQYVTLPAIVVWLDDGLVARTAEQELVRGIEGMLGRTLHEQRNLPGESAIVLGTFKSLREAGLAVDSGTLQGDAYALTRLRRQGGDRLVIAGATERGILYGVFAFLSKIARGESVFVVDDQQQPSAPLRWVNQWDNLDGHIERGYAGPSIFFEGGQVRNDLSRAGEYARLLASVGINGCTVNNVNADPRVLSSDFIAQVARIADAFRPWGVQLSLSVDLSSPKKLGDLDTFDPADRRVSEWWEKKVAEIYKAIPDFGGFVVKADSEGRAGPSSYGRSPADAANVIARALKPHGGVLFYRAFVYDHHLDWRNLKNDRARAAYDIFHPLDGKFDDNVIIQIKYGPIDFQVREPVSPLFGGLQHTNEAIELQITQEYTGQQRHLCFLVPLWKEILDFDLHANGSTPVKQLVSGESFHRPTGGYAGVANVGMDANWLAHPLALANLYGFGRLAWNPDLTASAIAEEWTRLTYGNDPAVVRTIREIQLASWPAYENYTGPLGIGTLTDILGSHYGPGPASSEENGWGQWHRADHAGVGMDRSVATGTGFIGQYSPPVQELYETLAKCPDNLLLFFHHVPYTYILHSGKTVIQAIYDAHYDGAQRAQQFVERWKSLRGRVDDATYTDVLARLEYQAGHAIVWRDAINDWFRRMSGIEDAHGRVGHHADRIEAEAMRLEGYDLFEVQPWEAASGGKAVECPAGQRVCTVAFQFKGKPGRYELSIEYFDLNTGASQFRVYVGKQLVDQWSAHAALPFTKSNADTSMRRLTPVFALRPGEEIRIEGVPNGAEKAELDYVELHHQAER